MKKISGKHRMKNILTAFVLTLVLSCTTGTFVYAESTPQATETFNYVTYFVVNCKQSITLRPAADVNSGEICQIPLGSSVTFVSAAGNGFYEIYYLGHRGYAMASYLAFQ